MVHSVFVSGNINDEKFIARGTAEIDPDQLKIRLDYSHVPSDWSVLAYSDPLVLLLGYREDRPAMNMTSLGGGRFTAVSTIDFGRGLLLRKTATIENAPSGDGDACDPTEAPARYDLYGGARCSGIREILPYEEFMHPVGEGQYMGIGLARWRTDSGLIEAVVSTRYRFERSAMARGIAETPIAMVRGHSVSPLKDLADTVYEATYDSYIRPLL